MSKIKLLTIAVVGLLLTNATMLGFLLFKKPAAPMGAMSPGKGEGPKKIIIERLHFNSDQVKQYELLITSHRKAIRLLKDSIGETKNELYRSLQTDNFSGKDSLTDLLSTLQKRIETVHYDHFAQIKKLCTPEQQEAFNALTHDLAFYFTTERKPPPPRHDGE
jgi:periplasmic protein CpxP/Spy